MDGQPQRQELRSDGEPREEEFRNGEANATAGEMADSLPQGTEAEAGPLLEGMEANGAHNGSSSFGQFHQQLCLPGPCLLPHPRCLSTPLFCVFFCSPPSPCSRFPLPLSPSLRHHQWLCLLSPPHPAYPRLLPPPPRPIPRADNLPHVVRPAIHAPQRHHHPLSHVPLCLKSRRLLPPPSRLDSLLTSLPLLFLLFDFYPPPFPPFLLSSFPGLFPFPLPSGTAVNGSTSPPHPTPPPLLLSLLFLRLSRALTTLPTPSDLRFTLLTIIAISPLMYLFASWADAFYLPQAGFPISLILFVFVFPSFWEELFWRVLLNPHPAEPPSPLPSWLHTCITSLLARTSSPLTPFVSSVPFLRSFPLPRDWLVDPKVFYGILSTSLYVLAHPFLAWLSRPAALRLFSHPGFLLCCVVLGTACLVVYRRSGSVWAAILVHWAAVSVWMCLGGRHQAPF
ncbi:unnamed protein product [Closterium sp. NIES-54]